MPKENFLTLEDVLNIEDTQSEDYFVEAWGGSIVIRTLTAAARDEYEQSCLVKDEEGNLKKNPLIQPAKFVAACVYQKDGKKMFRSPAHVKALEEKSFTVINDIFEQCIKVNKIGDDEVEEEVKN